MTKKGEKEAGADNCGGARGGDQMIYSLVLNIFNQLMKTQRVSQQNLIEIYILKKFQIVWMITSQNL